MKNIKKWIFPCLVYPVSLATMLFWLALRVNYSGISKFLGADDNQSFLIMNLPLMACGLAILGFCITLLGIVMWKKHKWVCITGFAISLVTLIGGGVVVYFGAKDYLRFIMVHFWESAAYALGLTALAALLFFPITGKGKLAKGCKVAILVFALVVCLIIGYELKPCHFTYKPVVYAVEDDYQIVFSTSDSAVGWVEIDGKCYYDLYAGSARSKDHVHKITLPQEILDAAGGYKICAQQMIYRGPFGGYKGKVLSESYSFRAVDPADGLNYASLSDVHEAVDAAARAARDESLDFAVLIGDIVSMVETEADAQMANRLAHAITGGQIPVIYARGNHEIKGEYAEDLYKYVGSHNQSFSYTVTLADTVFAVVLDMGEDHEDDWWEYYGTAHFDLYRQEQLEMLEGILEKQDYQNYEYRMAICHIPVVFQENSGKFEHFRKEWTAVLNALETDISLSGHKHQVWMIFPEAQPTGEKLTLSTGYAGKEGKGAGGRVHEFQFPAFLVGQRSLEQTGGTQSDGDTDYLCLHTRVDLTAGKQTHFYRNSLGKTVSVFYPFASETAIDDAPMTEFTTDLH